MLTRRQLLIRTGGASVALACFGTLPVSATADPMALSSARAATFAAILDAIHADPGYELADRAYRAGRFAEIYATGDDYFRVYADTVLDDLAERGVGRVDASEARHRLSGEALDLASLPFLEPNDSHPILFTIT